MGKKIDETLKYLGGDYSIKNIDCENVIYRQFSNFELEISGLNSRGKYNAAIYVWDNGRIIKTIQDITSKEELAKCLETVFQELSCRPA